MFDSVFFFRKKTVFFVLMICLFGELLYAEPLDQSFSVVSSLSQVDSEPTTDEFLAAMEEFRKKKWQEFVRQEADRTKDFATFISEFSYREQLGKLMHAFMKDQESEKSFSQLSRDFARELWKEKKISLLVSLYEVSPMNIQAALGPAIDEFYLLISQTSRSSLETEEKVVWKNLLEVRKTQDSAREKILCRSDQRSMNLPGYGELSSHYFYAKGKWIRTEVGYSRVREYPVQYEKKEIHSVLVPLSLIPKLKAKYKILSQGVEESYRDEGGYKKASLCRVEFLKDARVVFYSVEETLLDWYELYAMNKWYGLWFSKVGSYYTSKKADFEKKFLAIF